MVGARILNPMQKAVQLLIFRLRKILLILITIVQKSEQHPRRMMVRVPQMSVMMMAEMDFIGSAQPPLKSIHESYHSTMLLQFERDLHRFLHPVSYTIVPYIDFAFSSTSLCREIFSNAQFMMHIEFLKKTRRLS